MERITALELEQGDRVEYLATGIVYEVCGTISKWRNKPNVFSIPVKQLHNSESILNIITDRNYQDWIVLPTDKII